jgi:hypothetical protein
MRAVAEGFATAGGPRSAGGDRHGFAWQACEGVSGLTRVQGHVRVELRLASRAHTCNLVPSGSLAGVPARWQDRDAKPAV